MGNIIDTLIKRIEVPDRISLSATDREMLEQISKNLHEMKELKGVLAEQGASLDQSLETLKLVQNTERLDKLSSSLDTSTAKVITSLNMVVDRIQVIEKSINKQISGVKIMTGFAIWSSLLGVAVLIAHILGFI